MSDSASQGTIANVPESKVIAELFKSHWRIEDDVNSLRMRHMSAVGKLREQQADVRTRVKDAGLSVRVFKEMVAQEADRRRAANRKAKLEDDDVDMLGVMQEKLGHLFGSPLGEAAVAAAEAKKQASGRRKADLNSELDGIGAGGAGDNVTRLQRGISPTN